MRITCKNVKCKHYYDLSNGEHCTAEEYCGEYTSNRKKARRDIVRCIDCRYCKVIYTHGMREYHYECTYKGRNKTILIIEERICDCTSTS